jgi:hypothetical protein
VSELETELRKAIAGGQLQGMTLFHSPQGWQGSVRWKTSLGWTVEIDADPTVALVRALRSTTRYDPKPAAVEKPAPAAEPVLSGGLFD